MTARMRRRADIRRRVSNPKDAYERCRVFGCRQPTTAQARKGLHRLYCRRHVDHYRRHGSYFRASYSVSELTSYRRAAHDWLDSHRDASAVDLAVSAIQRLYDSAGQHIEAFRLTGRKPDERARAAWARLREAGIDPLRPLAAWLALEMKLIDDPQADRSAEYKRVQGAKLVHRLASGTHKRWEQEGRNGRIIVTELHKYPASRGVVLRHIGEAIESAAAPVVEAHLEVIHARVEAEQ